MTAIAVLFDMDGVLVDSSPLHVRAYERVFADAGIEFPESAREAVRGGRPRSEVIEISAPGASDATKRQLFEAKPKALALLLEAEGDPSMPGANRLLQILVENAVPVGVVTNSKAPRIWLEAIGIAGDIRVVVTNDDVSEPKPSPEGYLRAAEQLGVSPKRCLVFEDSHDGWLAASAAGMSVVVVSASRPDWVSSDTSVVDSLGAPGVLERCLRAGAGDAA